jgi:hypothetical protein
VCAQALQSLSSDLFQPGVHGGKWLGWWSSLPVVCEIG